MRNRLRWATALAGTTLLCSSCSSSDPGHDSDVPREPRTEWLAEGSGEPNAEPLAPAAAGARRLMSDLKVVGSLGSVRRWDTLLSRRFDGDVLWFEEFRADGRYLHGSVDGGRLARPHLTRPATVRAGMSWRAWYDDAAPPYVYRVLDPEEQDTIFGRRRVWPVEREHDGETVVQYYAEGRGAVVPTGPGSGLYESIVPLEPEPAAADELAAEATPFPDGDPVVVGFAAAAASAAYDPETVGTPWRLRMTGVNHWGREEVRCFYTDGEELLEDPSECPDAQVAIRTAGGYYSGTGTAFAVSGAPIHLLGSGATSSAFEMGLTVSVMPGATDEPGLPAASGPWLRGWPSLVPPLTAEPVDAILIDGVEPDGSDHVRFGFALRSLDRVYHGSFSNGLFGGPRLAASVPEALISAVLEADNRRTHWLVSPDGLIRRLTVAVEGIRVERMARIELPVRAKAVAALGLDDRILLLASAVVPSGMSPDEGPTETPGTLGWTIPMPDEPLAATDLAATARAALSVRAVDQDLKVCRPPDSEQPILEGWTLGDRPATAISASADGSCVLVLRDLASDPQDLREGYWSAAGPVPGVGRVAFGVANATAGLRPPVSEPHLEYVVPLPDGSAVSPTFVYGPGFHVERPNPAPCHADITLGAPCVADSASHGLWSATTDSSPVNCPTAPCRSVRFTGTTTFVMYLPSPHGTVPLPVLGGGVLLPIDDAVNDYALVRADGSRLDLPLPAGFDLGPKGARADGTLCGWSELDPATGEQRMICFDAEGSRRESSPIAPTTEGLPSGEGLCGASWCPANGGFYGERITFDGLLTIVRLDIDAMELTPVPIALLDPVPFRGFARAIHGPDGEFFLRVGSEEEFGRLFRVSGTGATEVTIPGLDSVAGTPTGAVAVRGFWIVFVDDGEDGLVVRIPRES